MTAPVASDTWTQVAANIGAPTVSMDYRLAMCEHLVRHEVEHLERTGRWEACPEAAPIYAALRAYRQAIRPAAWAQFASLLVARVVPPGTASIDVVAAMFYDLDADPTTDASQGGPGFEMAWASTSALAVLVWVATRLGGPPNPAEFTAEMLEALLQRPRRESEPGSSGAADAPASEPGASEL